jgi:hypothetical protein
VTGHKVEFTHLPLAVTFESPCGNDLWELHEGEMLSITRRTITVLALAGWPRAPFGGRQRGRCDL